MKCTVFASGGSARYHQAMKPAATSTHGTLVSVAQSAASCEFDEKDIRVTVAVSSDGESVHEGWSVKIETTAVMID